MTTGGDATGGRVTALAHGALGLHLGLLFSGAGFDLMWQLPVAAMTLWFAVFSAAAVLALNAAQLVLGCLAVVLAGWGPPRPGGQALHVAARGVGSGTLVALVNAVPGLQAAVTQLMNLAPPWPGLALALGMSWESWLAVLAYGVLGLVALARPTPLLAAPARNALAFAAPLLLCAAVMSALFPLGVGGVALMALVGGSDPAAPAAALGYVLLRQGISTMLGGVGIFGLVAAWFPSSRAHLGAALLSALVAGLAFVGFLGVGALPAALAVAPAVPAGCSAFLLAHRDRAAALQASATLAR